MKWNWKYTQLLMGEGTINSKTRKEMQNYLFIYYTLRQGVEEVN